MQRRFYITNVLNKKGTTLNDKKELAKQMRNSVGAQSLHYYKVGTYDGKTNDELILMLEELAGKIELLEKNQKQTDKETSSDSDVDKAAEAEAKRIRDRERKRRLAQLTAK